jgi:hypothetical protein
MDIVWLMLILIEWKMEEKIAEDDTEPNEEKVGRQLMCSWSVADQQQNLNWTTTWFICFIINHNIFIFAYISCLTVLGDKIRCDMRSERKMS